MMSAVLSRMLGGIRRLSTQIPSILREPRAYPREAMIMAVAAVLAVLIVVLLSFVLYDAIVEARGKRRLGLRVRRRLRPRVGGAALWAVVLMLGVTALPWIPAVGGSCGSCHQVRPAVSSWESGKHASVSCYACHAPDRVTGGISAAVEGGARMAFGARAASDIAPSDACLRCHRGIRDTVTHGSMRVRHEEIIDAGIACPDCHADVGHEGSAKDEPTGEAALLAPATMSRCLLCHDGRTAFSACQKCHTRAPSDSSSSPSRPGTTPIKVTCAGCHDEATQQRCIGCHGLEMPHPDDFLRRHAATSYARPQLCKRCHDDAGVGTCSCHSEPNVHGTFDAWFPQHGRAAAVGREGCNCHNLGFCYFCHETNPF